MYIHLMDSEVNSLMNREGEMAIKVAYYFPGVMMTLGASKWEVMKKLFTRLIMTKNNVPLVLVLGCQNANSLKSSRNQSDHRPITF